MKPQVFLAKSWQHQHFIMILVLCFCWSNPKLVLVNLNRTFYFLGVNFHLLMLEKSKVCSRIQPIWPSCWWFSYEIHLSSTSLEWIKTYWSINPTVLLSVPWCPPKNGGFQGVPPGPSCPSSPRLDLYAAASSALERHSSTFHLVKDGKELRGLEGSDESDGWRNMVV